ncbi:DUF6377 domain-containing protein [Xanthocytophaga flava]|uniref:DUF6377 domain-containing protein n=1 Tax=Xanthocytophaga flava TaxID=3048013 RepID=UPI0028D3359D|nr:DUF6377 domain-containing protein [Xanthocytophaga flavus]MDJ1467069.1 DUF6377 domain-containing protein [Xanthocytophaga flavus]
MKDIHIASVCFTLFFCLTFTSAFSINTTDSLLHVLTRQIEGREIYIREKEHQINQLRDMLRQEDMSLQQQFKLYSKLYTHYQSFQYDSAFAYALRLEQKARQLNDPVKIEYAKLKISFTLLSSGMYKEAFDSLNAVHIQYMPDSLNVEYHVLQARAFHDLATYNADKYYASSYLIKGNMHLDSALTHLASDKPEYAYLSGLKYFKEKKYDEAIREFVLVLGKYPPSSHDYAKTASSLAGVYRDTGNTSQAIELLCKAAIADIQSAIQENLALLNLAELLYQTGDQTNAYLFIKRALADAIAYGARQRQTQVGTILPIIEGERLVTAESQKSKLFVYASIVSLLSLLVVIFAIIIFKQLKQLRIAKKTVTEANQSLQEANEKLTEVNLILKQTNDHLIEANKIKEEYIGYSFNMYSDYLNKLEKLKQSVERKLLSKKYEDINHVIDSVNLKKERENLFQSFDQIFVTLFPNFITVFNSYFEEENEFTAKEKGSFSIEFRIFALIRMGIHDPEQIAKILGYSIRTIYNYKTKVKNKSFLSNEEFEQKIMEIRAF